MLGREGYGLRIRRWADGYKGGFGGMKSVVDRVVASQRRICAVTLW